VKKKYTIIFSDLDGTILDKNSFKFDKIKNYIRKLISKRVILVPNSSKTEIEIKNFIEELGIDLPFICENGSAIHNLNLINKKLPKKLILSKDIKSISKLYLEKVPLKIRKKIIDLRKINKADQIKIFGLPKNKIKHALKRSFTIPIKFTDEIKDKKKFIKIIKNSGLKIQEGGRIMNLGDNVDKSLAMQIFLKKVKTFIKDPIKTIGIGDSHNDIGMLKNTDIPCLVYNEGFNRKNIKIKKLIVSDKPSPQGWADVIKKAVLKK